jgi:fatty-acyl-CoA synthase
VVLTYAAPTFDELIRPFGVTDTGITFVDPDGSTHLSYDEIASRAASASQDLSDRGVKPGDTVAVVIESTPAGVAALLAVWLAGATVMSLPPPPRRGKDEALPLYKEAFGDLLRSCVLVLGSSRLQDALAPEHEVTDTASLDFSSGRPAPDVEVAEVALIQFTSGSTGTPRGVVLHSTTIASHTAAICEAVDFHPEDGDSCVSWLPLYHDMGLIGMLLSPMNRRGPLVLMTPSVFARDPGAWMRKCAETGATVTCAPDFAYRLAARVSRFGKPIGDLSALRVCLCGAERVQWATMEAFAEAFEDKGLRWEALKPVYGMAETTLAISFPPNDRGPRRSRGDVVALGHPLPGIEVRIDDSSGTDVGRIGLKGPWMFDSYLTSQGRVEAFDEDGWFWTNDVGFVEDGELFVLGRTDEAVIVRGRNVFAEDVEAIATWAPGVEAIGAAAFRAAEGDDRFALVVEVLNDDARELSRFGRDIQASVTQALEATVSPVVFVRPKTIPRTTSGKPIRRACREIHAGAGWEEDSVVARVT